ncbi:hypothetical protein MJI69_30505, partial [Salmonella enterica subsp. enterica serovar Anatum]|nr:hypothetical protein [Salmonella enterica subsp. enterica serovar Anatum]
IQKLPVMFAIDRAGIVGADGQTHQGAFDLSYLRCIPDMVIMTQSRITQLQMGYSNQWRNISYGVNIARQRTTWDYDRFYHGVNE